MHIRIDGRVKVRFVYPLCAPVKHEFIPLCSQHAGSKQRSAEIGRVRVCGGEGHIPTHVHVLPCIGARQRHADSTSGGGGVNSLFNVGRGEHRPIEWGRSVCGGLCIYPLGGSAVWPQCWLCTLWAVSATVCRGGRIPCGGTNFNIRVAGRGMPVPHCVYYCTNSRTCASTLLGGVAACGQRI